MRVINAVGTFIGIVEDTVDTQKANRLKIRVPDFYGTPEDGIPTKSLPWATPADGTVISPPPAIGTMVCVTFKHGEANFPVYSGYVMPALSNKCSQCRHMFRAKCCKAYPGGIPDDIYNDETPHLVVRANQNGRFVFSQK